MEFTEDMIREALEGKLFYEHTHPIIGRKEPPAPKKVKPVAVVEPTKPSKIYVKATPKTIKEYRAAYRPLLRAVAEAHGLEPEQIASSLRTPVVVAARQHYAWELRQRTGMSYPWIGEAMKVDHSTALHNIKRFEALKDKYIEQIEYVRKACP